MVSRVLSRRKSFSIRLDADEKGLPPCHPRFLVYEKIKEEVGNCFVHMEQNKNENDS